MRKVPDIFRLLIVGCVVVICTASSQFECDVCELAVDVLGNANDTRMIDRALVRECQTLSKRNESFCEHFVEELCETVTPFVRKEIDSLAWSSRGVCAALQLCDVPCCLAETKPEQIHLSLAEHSDEMWVTWVTLRNTSSHIVQWSLDEQDLTRGEMSNGTADTYSHLGWIGQIHYAKMQGLKPSLTYFYRVGDNSSSAQTTMWSDIFSFRTLPSNSSLRIVFLADMGLGDASDDTIRRVESDVLSGKVDLVVHNGDISYSDGDESHWDAFMRKIECVASRVPYMTVPGNHEFLFNFTAYKKRFRMPSENEESMYYALTIGTSPRIKMVGIDTESPLDLAFVAKSQREWLHRVLEQEVNNFTSGNNWTVVFGHRPLYCSNHGGQDVPEGNYLLRALAEEAFITHGVDLVVQGHLHDYERSYPLRYGFATQHNYSSPTNAPIYVVNGAAGNREGNSNPPGNRDWNAPGACSEDVSYALVTFTPKEINWRQIRSSDGGLVDEWSLQK